MVWLVGCWRDHQHPSEQPASGEYTPLPLQARGLIVGPHWMGMLGTNFCIVAPCTVFYLLAFLRPTQGYESVHVGLSVGLAVLMLATMLALAFTGCRDPGVIPKQLPEQLEAQRRVREQQRVEAGEHAGDTESLSTCRRCNVMRPPRAQHCIYCDVCVLELDHHCPWMGMCVGKNNIKSFHAFNILWPITMGYFCISFLVYMMLSIVSTRLVPGASLAILNSSTNATG